MTQSWVPQVGEANLRNFEVPTYVGERLTAYVGHLCWVAPGFSPAWIRAAMKEALASGVITFTPVAKAHFLGRHNPPD